MEYDCILNGHLLYFTAIWYILWPFWYILWSFGIFFPVLVLCTRKNLATLTVSRCHRYVAFEKELPVSLIAYRPRRNFKFKFQGYFLRRFLSQYLASPLVFGLKPSSQVDLLAQLVFKRLTCKKATD
jgi:hypothetical protein